MDRTLDGYGFVYEEATGRLVSHGTVITDPLPDGLALLETPAQMTDVEQWDPVARAPRFVPDAERADELVRQAQGALDEAERVDPSRRWDRPGAGGPA